jgi:hypothetical protein
MVTRRPNIVIAISIVLASAILAIAVWVLAQMRDDALRRAQDSVFNVSLLIERDISRNLEIYDLSLRAVLTGLKQPGLMDLPPAIRQMVLFDGSAGARDIGSVFVFDENGNVRFDSQSSPPRKINVADRDYFQVQRDSPDVGLYISRPFMPKAAGKEISIALSRRISRPDGSFGGVVVGTIRLAYFHRLFDGMNLGPGGSMALILHDGTMLMRRPYDPKTIGINLAGTANYSRLIAQPSGNFIGTASIDGVERWYAFRHIDMYPLILDVALSTHDIYVEWRHRAWIIGSLIAALDATLIALAILFSQQLHHRRVAEDELREPPYVRNASGRGMAARAAQRLAAVDAADRRRQLQGFQRSVRPFGGRRSADHGGAQHRAECAASGRYGGAFWRRGICGAAAGHERGRRGLHRGADLCCGAGTSGWACRECASCADGQHWRGDRAGQCDRDGPRAGQCRRWRVVRSQGCGPQSRDALSRGGPSCRNRRCRTCLATRIGTG